MKRRFDDGATDLPESKRGGSYPPDVERMRRRYGLPVTTAEHLAYERHEWPLRIDVDANQRHSRRQPDLPLLKSIT